MRVERFGNALDDAAFPCGVSPFEDDDHAQTLLLDPSLELDEFDLQLGEFFFIFAVGQRREFIRRAFVG